jgi:amino acid permease
MLEARRSGDHHPAGEWYGTMKPSVFKEIKDVGEVSIKSNHTLKDHTLKETEPKTTAQGLTINLIAGGLGAGIFSLPWSTAGASLIPSLLTIGGVLTLNGWTMMILVNAAESKKAFDLGGLLRNCPGKLGPIMEVACNMLVWISGFMCLISYFIIIADSTVPFAGHSMLRSRYVVVGLTAVFILPLTFLNQRNMSWTSSLVVLVNVYIFMLLCALHEVEPAPADVCFLGFSTGSIAMVSAMMQAVIIQMCILPMYQQLEDRSPQKFRGIVMTAFSGLFAIFGGFSAIAYLTFGPEVHGNVLLDLPHNRWGNLARIASSLSVMGVFPLVLMPMIAPIKNYRGFTGGASNMRELAATIAKVIIITMVTLAAYMIHDLGVMNVFNGAFCVGGMVGVCPAMAGLYLLEGKPSMWWNMAMYGLMGVCLTMSVLGLVYTDNYAAELTKHCLQFI